jgi:serine protease Do
MTNEKLSALRSQREPKRSLSARKLALMASVVTGLCIAGNGFSSSPGGFIFGTAAHAQAGNAVSGVAQPTGFADMVDRVKPSVISIKVTMKEKVVDADSKTDDGSDSPMER